MQTSKISKETFCKVIALIKEQEKINEEVDQALKKVCGSYVVFGANNRYLEGLLLLLKEALPDPCDYVGWWLYETDDYHVWSADYTQDWNLKDPGDLYDYIVNETNGLMTKPSQ